MRTTDLFGSCRQHKDCLSIDPAADRLTPSGFDGLLCQWRHLVRGHIVATRDIKATAFRPWRHNLLVVHRLPGPLTFSVTHCGSRLAQTMGCDPRGAMVHGLIAANLLPRSLYEGLQQCVDRRCPIHLYMEDTKPAAGAPSTKIGPAPQSLFLPVGRGGPEPSHIMIAISGLALALPTSPATTTASHLTPDATMGATILDDVATAA